jgi:glycosyltransferase involved in cell wall biosynthesis
LRKLEDISLSVVMPAYNERTTIEEMIQRVMDVPVKKEVIVVDDGSKDGTRDILTALQERYPAGQLRVVFQPQNRGKGAALRRGFELATCDYVIIQDADLEYDPRDYLRMLQPCLEHDADVVYGSRFAGGSQRRVLFFWHAVGNRFLTTLSNMFTDLNLTDMETCYKLFRREIIQGLSLERDRFGFEPEVTAKISHQNYRIFEVGISYDGRSYDEGTKIGWKDGVEAIWCIAKYGFQQRSIHRATAAPYRRRTKPADSPVAPEQK